MRFFLPKNLSTYVEGFIFCFSFKLVTHDFQVMDAVADGNKSRAEDYKDNDVNET